MAQYQALFGFIKPRLKSLLEKVKLKTRKRVAVLLPPRCLSKTKITMTIKEIQDLELNRTITMKWTMKNMKTTLRPKFVRTYYKNSALVTDNASYHSKYSEDHPKSTWKKAQYDEWLKKRKIPYAKDALRPTLWKLAKEKRENYPAYRLEKIAYKYGHEIVRLPPYHCQLNPIELIWGIEKSYVASENKEHKLSEVEDLFRKKREEMDQETCKKCTEHVKRIEEEFYKSDRIIDVAVEKLEININPNSDLEMSDMSDFLNPMMNDLMFSLIPPFLLDLS